MSFDPDLNDPDEGHRDLTEGEAALILAMVQDAAKWKAVNNIHHCPECGDIGLVVDERCGACDWPVWVAYGSIGECWARGYFPTFATN